MAGESWWQAAIIKGSDAPNCKLLIDMSNVCFFLWWNPPISSIYTLYTYDVSLKQTYDFFYLYIYIHMHSNVEHTSPILKKVQPWNHQVMIVFRIRWILWSRTSKHLEHQGKFILKDKHVTCIESSNHLCVCVLFFVQLLNLEMLFHGPVDPIWNTQCLRQKIFSNWYLEAKGRVETMDGCLGI